MSNQQVLSNTDPNVPVKRTSRCCYIDTDD
jgi:hypothetical protein